MTILRVCYKSGIRFDEVYYTRKHLPLSAEVFGSYIRNVEVMKVTTTPDGTTPVYQFIFSVYFDSPAQLQAAMQDPRLADILGDIKNYYDGAPDIMIGEALAFSGTS